MGKLLDAVLSKKASDETAENAPKEEAPKVSDVEKQAADLVAQGSLLGMGFNLELIKEGAPLHDLASLIDDLTKEALSIKGVGSAIKNVATGAADKAGGAVKKLIGNTQGHNLQHYDTAKKGLVSSVSAGKRIKGKAKQYVGRHERGVGAAVILAGAGGAGYAGHKVVGGGSKPKTKVASMLIHIENGEEDFTKEAFFAVAPFKGGKYDSAGGYGAEYGNKMLGDLTGSFAGAGGGAGIGAGIGGIIGAIRGKAKKGAGIGAAIGGGIGYLAGGVTGQIRSLRKSERNAGVRPSGVGAILGRGLAATGGGLAGAGVGALAGSALGPVGRTVGAVLGGTAGGIAGDYLASRKGRNLIPDKSASEETTKETTEETKDTPKFLTKTAQILSGTYISPSSEESVSALNSLFEKVSSDEKEEAAISSLDSVFNINREDATSA